MRTYTLKKKGIRVIEGQRNAYISDNRVHKRSYMCVVMKKDLFHNVIEPHISKFGIKYVTQTTSAWNMCAMGDTGESVWLTKIRGRGHIRMELLTDEIEISDDEIYVAMWYKRFLSTFMRRGRLYDADYILCNILEGQKRPISWPLRFLSSFFWGT